MFNAVIFALLFAGLLLAALTSLGGILLWLSRRVEEALEGGKLTVTMNQAIRKWVQFENRDDFKSWHYGDTSFDQVGDLEHVHAAIHFCGERYHAWIAGWEKYQGKMTSQLKSEHQGSFPDFESARKFLETVLTLDGVN